MRCVMCGRTVKHGLNCANCGYNYSKAATFTSLFELDVTTINGNITNETQSLEHRAPLDGINPERVDADDRQIDVNTNQHGSLPKSTYVIPQTSYTSVSQQENQHYSTTNREGTVGLWVLAVILLVPTSLIACIPMYYLYEYSTTNNESNACDYLKKAKRWCLILTFFMVSYLILYLVIGSMI